MIEKGRPRLEEGRIHGVAVIVPAGGRGTRMGGLPKQFRPLGDAPMLLQTLRALDAHPDVAALVVATLPDRIAETEAWAARLATLYAVVQGGSSRQASVAAGLDVLPADTEYVLVHDAARPFVARGAIGRVIAATRTHGAAALAVPVADTLRHASGETFGETVPREGLWRMQTPQGARADWLRAAHTAADSDAPTTDEVGLLQAAGYTVGLVEGDPANDKVTTRADWARAERRWAHRTLDFVTE